MYKNLTDAFISCALNQNYHGGGDIELCMSEWPENMDAEIAEALPRAIEKLKDDPRLVADCLSSAKTLLESKVTGECAELRRCVTDLLRSGTGVFSEYKQHDMGMLVARSSLLYLAQELKVGLSYEELQEERELKALIPISWLGLLALASPENAVEDHLIAVQNNEINLGQLRLSLLLLEEIIGEENTRDLWSRAALLGGLENRDYPYE